MATRITKNPRKRGVKKSGEHSMLGGRDKLRQVAQKKKPRKAIAEKFARNHKEVK